MENHCPASPLSQALRSGFRTGASIIALTFLTAFIPPAGAQQATVVSTRLDTGNRFVVECDVPAGAGYAALETLAPAKSGVWKTTISGAIDGRAARVSFSLPRPDGAPTVLARVRTAATGAAVPVAELTDPALLTISYSGGGGTTVSEATKIAVLKAAAAKMREWSALPRTERQASLIAWAKSQAGVEDAYVNPVADNVCLQFQDGDTSVLLNRQRTDGSTPPNLIPQGQRIVEKNLAANGVAVRDDATTGLPDTDNAVAAYSLEAATFPNSAPTIAGWLTAANYNTRTFSSTTVDDIKTWAPEGNPLGVLFWQAHGCSYGKPGDFTGIAIVTRQTATLELSAGAYKEMRANGELMLAKDERETEPLYTVTSKFVKKYMHFAPHSLVILDTCYAAHLEIAGAFITAGAGAYTSWDGESGVESTTPILKVFDRLTGSNQEPPLSTPPERPFSLPVIRQWMRTNEYDIDPSPKYPNQDYSNPRLIWQTHPTAPAHILRPSVMRVLHEFSGQDEPFTKFLLEGDFGSDPGASKRKVTWGDREMEVLRWDKDNGIVIKPPAPPPAGDFKVIIRNNHASNANPYSEWTVPFTYEFSGKGSLNYKVEMNVKLRGDIHGSRYMPEMDVQYTPIPFGNLNDCTGQITAGGLYKPDPDTTITWSGGTALRSVDASQGGNTPAVNLLFNGGVLVPSFGAIINFSLQNTGTFTEKTNNSTSTVGAPLAGFDWPPPTIQLNLGNNAITGNTLYYVDPEGNGSAKLSWPTVIPVSSPTIQTPR